MNSRTEVNWTPLPVPLAVQSPSRIPKQRYYDPDFYAAEAELFWPRVWQMGCRLEEIPKAGDFVEYEILDQSIIVVRLDADTVAAYHNACRHRGVKLVEGNGSLPGARRTFVCPFHGWCWGIDGRNTFVLRPEAFAEENMSADDLQLVSVKCELWGGCVWINLGDHVPQPHPQLLPSAQTGAASEAVHPVVASSLYFMRTLGDGMGGMTHENDIRIAEGMQTITLPSDPAEALAGWRGALNDAVVAWHRARGSDMPDLNDLVRRGITDAIGFAFPHHFILPTYSSASSYRIRPLGPEETLFEIWSLTRMPGDMSSGKPTPPEPLAPDDPRWPPIPAQDFSNLPRQQKGLHSKGFEYMRLSDQIEGLISNFERVVDGFLAGLPYDALVPAIQKTNTTIDVPIADLGFTSEAR